MNRTKYQKWRDGQDWIGIALVITLILLILWGIFVEEGLLERILLNFEPG